MRLRLEGTSETLLIVPLNCDNSKTIRLSKPWIASHTDQLRRVGPDWLDDFVGLQIRLDHAQTGGPAFLLASATGAQPATL